MAKTFRPYAPDQMLLLPPSLREWLPEDHPVYFVNDLVETLDLEPILSAYSEERGYPPYHPLLMSKLIIYGYVRGLRSSRKIQRACVEDVAFRVLAAGQSPDFRTVADFRARHLKALEDFFGQVVHPCRQAGLVKLGHVAVDGTKVKANASKHKAMSYARMKKEEERLQGEIRRWFEECEATDAAEDELYGPDKTGDELPEALADPKRRLQAIQETKAALEAEAQAKGKQEPDTKAQRNFTDPDSKIMVSGDKAFIQAYNCQAAVDADSQVILVAQVSQQAPDQGQLLPMVEQVTLEQEQVPQKVSADAGYWKGSDIELLEANDIEPFVAPKRMRRSLWRQMTVPRGRIPKGLSRKERMLRKLCTQRGRAQYQKRETSVEPVFGQIKEAQGFRQFLLRGHRKAQGEWSLLRMANNIPKFVRSGWDLAGAAR